jgi:hypothetical protein
MAARRRRTLSPLERAAQELARQHAAELKIKRELRRDRRRRVRGRVVGGVWAARRYVGLFYLAVLAVVVGAGVSHRAAATGAVVAAGVVAALICVAVARAKSWPTFSAFFWPVVALAGCGWLAVVSRAGVGAPMPGVLFALALAGSVPWWVHVYRLTHAVEPEPEPKPVVEIDPRLIRFEERGAGTYLPKGTRLLDFADVQVDDDGDAEADMLGWSTTVLLPPDSSMTYANIASKAANFAGTFGVPASSVVIEMTDDQIPDRAKLTVLTRRNPAHAVNYYDRTWQVLENGCFPFGVFPDGRRSWHCLYEPGSGPVHSLISGDTRTGKSSTVSLLITQATMTGFVVPFVADPQGGQSMPEWAGPQGQAWWIAWDRDEIWRQTKAIWNLMQSRNRELTARAWVDEDGTTRRGYSYFDPEVITDLPIIDWTLDEAHNLLSNDSDYANLVTDIVKMASKCGVRVNLVTQHPAVTPDLGGRTDLRNQLGNLHCHRNGSNTVKGMLLPEDMPSPFDIPKVNPSGEHTKGTNVSFSPAKLGDRRAFQRTARSKNPFKWAETAVQQIARPPSKTDEEAMGDDYAKRWERFNARGSKPVTIPLAVAEPRQPKPTPPSPRTADRIVAYLGEDDANGRLGAIATRLNLPKSSVGTALKKLAEAGKVRQVRHGIWALPEPETADEVVPA